MQGTTRARGAVRLQEQNVSVQRAAATRRQGFDACTSELHRPNDTEVFWTMPWRLAKEDLAQLPSGRAWPDELFEFFIASIQDEVIIGARGAHSFFDVLFAYRSNLSVAQKEQLGAALDARIRLDYSGWAANCRLKEFLHGRHAVEAVLRERVEHPGSHPEQAKAAIHNAISLFRTFEIKSSPANVSITQCTVSTELNPEPWTFSVDVPYWKFGTRESSAPRREDLFTSRFREEDDGPMACLEDTLSILDIYDLKNRTDTLLSLPGALADTQKVFSQGVGWASPVFDGLLKVVEVMRSNEVPASHRFGVVLEALSGPCRPTSPRGPAPAPIFSILSTEQKALLLSWLGEHVDEFEDYATRDLVARFVVDIYPREEADAFFQSVRDSAGIARDHRHTDAARGLVRARDDYLRSEEKGNPRTRSRSSVSGSSVSPAPGRVQSEPAVRRGLRAIRDALPPLTPRSISTPRSPRDEL